MTHKDLEKEIAQYVEALQIHQPSDEQGHISTDELKTTPLFSWPVRTLFHDPAQDKQDHFQQYSLLGMELPEVSEMENGDINACEFGDMPESKGFNSTSTTPTNAVETDGWGPSRWSIDRKPTARKAIDKSALVFLNTDAPWSAFICGSQGSGKSYTLSCMLENCLLSATTVGYNANPLSGLVFHYDGHLGSGVCEAAYLGNLVPVTVLCSPSNYYNLENKYAKLKGKGMNIKVKPLFLKDQHLNTQRMVRLMAFNDKDGAVPLYMEVLMYILKDMATDTRKKSGFDYAAFRKRIDKEEFAPGQKGPLNLRLQLLESFMETGDIAKKFPRSKQDLFRAQPSHLTIVDLTDPFVDPASACVLFDICLAIFLQDGSNAGKVVALDEAHKFMDENSASTVFTEHLLSIIREQRHKGVRVIVSTQEPTISPKLLDLCSMTIVHRFTSPDWLKMLQSHLAGASKSAGKTKDDLQHLFQEIVNLNVGESLLFSPSAILHPIGDKLQKLGTRRIKFRTRPRLTADGGGSIMASSAVADVAAEKP